ncbi:head decoration protein [Aquamicrobium zhengzhouense]|uniref:Head decoration protein n=1 Tax=Aquamicrobium zhengzhouense TaxID=2781738 RepID=A0ABS0S9V2_9HYPH|nr:head decoration protein [Aquamicrobium zhengzhouense]MBI1620011.1 head decoration protein [Aquamicrobium zhengzhouense]
MAINTPYLAHLAGFPGQWSDEINPVREGLILNNPDVVTVDMTIAASQTIAEYTPVGLNAAGDLVPAVWAADETAVKPVGITLFPITTPAGTPLKGVPILIQGGLNVDMIKWPVSFDTFEKKLEAFRGAPTPTNIVVKKAYLGATVAQP